MAAEGVAEEPGAVTLAPGGKAFFSIDYTPCSSGRHNQLGRAFYAEFYAHLTNVPFRQAVHRRVADAGLAASKHDESEQRDSQQR